MRHCGLLLIITVLMAACGRGATDTTGDAAAHFDAKPTAEGLLGAWEGSKGTLTFDGETLTATTYWCGKKPASPQFAMDSSCVHYDWKLGYELEGYKLNVEREGTPNLRNNYWLYLDESQDLHIAPTMWFGTLSGRTGHVDFAGLAQLDIEDSECHLTDVTKRRAPAHCRWRQHGGQTWLELINPFEVTPRPVELVYLESAGLLVTPEHAATFFHRVTP